MDFNENILRYIILFFIAIEFLWETYLGIRQYRKAKNTTQVPVELKDIMQKDVFDKARLYTLARLKFGFIQDTFSFFVTIFVLCSGFLFKVWDYSAGVSPVKGGEITTSCIWLLILSFISTVMNLPLSIYHTFFIEEKFGFNKQTAGFFVWDKIKSFIVTQIIVVAIGSVIIVTVRTGGDYFFVWLWASLFVLSLSLIVIYPTFIAPLFDKFTPLPEGELRTAIENLADKLDFPLKQLFVVEGSKRSSHSNAYFYGIFKEKRIVLFDTLMKKDDGTGCTDEEILAVLSHELGHWYHGHMVKNVVIMQLNIFLLIAFFAAMFRYPVLYKLVGFYNVKPVLVGFLVLLQYVMLPYHTVLSFIMTYVSRKFEFQADEFAVKLGRSRPLTSALVQLNKDNLSFPIYDYLYSAWHHSHPPLLERIEHLKKVDQKKH